MLRIVVLGDFHLKETELDWTKQCMADIRECGPDLVVPLGDFGSNRLIGSPEGLQQSYSLLSLIGKPMKAILGNHDLQRESGNNGQEHGTMERELIRLFRQPSAYGVIEESEFRLIFISTDPQPDDSCYQVQECYVSEEQFSWLTGKLQERKGVPVIMFTHAPPIGCGLRTVPGVHVRATNAYLDQNHDPMRWFRLIQNTPEIVVWFSAHYHLGHGYPDSSTNRLGTKFFTTGVHGSATRDGERLSRVLDISKNGIQVMTLDHRQRTIVPVADWTSSGSLSDLVSEKKKALSFANAEPPAEDESPTCAAACPLGDGEPVAGGLAHLDGDRWFVAANDGYLWEVSVSAEAVMGTLHLGSVVHHVSAGRNEVAYIANHRLLWANTADVWRFARDNPDLRNKRFIELEDGIASIAYDAGGRLWAASGRSLYLIHTKDNESAGMAPYNLVHTFPEAISQVKADGKRLAVLINGGTLHNMEDNRSAVLYSNVICWDRLGAESAALLEEGGDCYLAYRTAAASGKHHVQLNGEGYSAERCQIVCLGGGYILFNVSGEASLWNVEANRRCVIDTKTKVLAMCAGRENNETSGNKQFGLAVAAGGQHIRPQLQLWRI